LRFGLGLRFGVRIALGLEVVERVWAAEGPRDDVASDLGGLTAASPVLGDGT